MNKRPPILYLILGIPLSSLVVGMIMLFAAVNTDSGFVDTAAAPLSKTSWQQTQAIRSDDSTPRSQSNPGLSK